ncbi:hypothetical protein H5410_045417 [Solanum commersonii]|uniref:Uncharacterized protein n=1 Tax=Solanum commersonii TaxID=4109 RepID=A0A9J5XBJ5_SOLCO|nr:hypothetical protein H5410_045417 [Solanum commersonii]
MTLNIPTHNNFTSLDVHEQVTNNLYGKLANSTSSQNEQHSQKNQNAGISSNMEPVIDLRLPLPHNPTVISIETVKVIDGVSGGIGGGMKDTQTNMQEGETKWRDLPNVLQKGESIVQLQVPIIHHGSKHQASHQLDIGKSLQGLGKENPYVGTSARQQEKEGLHS